VAFLPRETALISPSDQPTRWVHWAGLPVLVLTVGHMLSSSLRTLPAVATDVIGADLLVSTETVASLAGAYHFAFAAGQIPVGIALDRYGVRNVSLTMLAGICAGALCATLINGPLGFLLVQIMLGLATSGMLVAPMTLVATTMPTVKFALWSGLVHGIGNSGMLLSASPMAWLIDQYGWRSCFLVSAAMALVVAAGVLVSVPRRTRPDRVVHCGQCVLEAGAGGVDVVRRRGLDTEPVGDPGGDVGAAVDRGARGDRDQVDVGGGQAGGGQRLAGGRGGHVRYRLRVGDAPGDDADPVPDPFIAGIDNLG
jgi:MFS family permease